MSLLPVDEAVARLLSGVEPLPAELVALDRGLGRVLADDLAARLTQPPFPASAMDGYAVRAEDAQKGAVLQTIGTSRAGVRFSGSIGAGEAVRIFTGAPVPPGADAILIQENTERDNEHVRVLEPAEKDRFIRPAGLDFKAGDTLLEGGLVLQPADLALAAAMGHSAIPVRRRPKIAFLSNGDELVPPGTQPGPDQIISSNGVGLATLTSQFGGEPIDLGIAPDRLEAIAASVDRAIGADILVIMGGASVGEHDLVQSALTDRGMVLDFWRIAMRPGKPLMVGKLSGKRVLGLPGNPVSTLVCGLVFLRPLIRAMLGLPIAPHVVTATLMAPLPENDERQDYVRARMGFADGSRTVTPFARQDSSMLATMAAADALIVRPIRAPAAAPGERVPVLLLRPSA
jgi:molybdopterin molybdotransferase